MSLAWRILVVVLLGLVLVQAVQLALFLTGRQGGGELVRLTTRQMVAATALYEQTAPETREAVLTAVAHPLLRVDVSDDLDFLDRRGWEPAPASLTAAVRSRLGPLAERDVVVKTREGWRRPPMAGHAGEPPPRRGPRPHLEDDRRWPWQPGELEPSRQRLAVSIPLADGGYLTFLTITEAISTAWVVRTAGLWLVTALGVLAVTWWMSRRVARPFQRFAAAADRLGLDVHAPPLDDRGSGELRQAVRAFNRMQERIRRMVDDRTLMLAAISHDLKTSLTRLRLRAEMIEDGEQRAKAVADLDEMQAMLEGALAFAKDEATAETSQPLDLARLLQAVVDDATDAGHEATYVGPERLAYVGRAVGLRRLAGNLLDNAYRYAGPAEVALVDEAEHVAIVVRDRGPGVPESERERVLEPFFRLERSRSRETGGAGLGLAIVRTVARAHGGDVALANRPGGGLEVTVTLAKLPSPAR